MKERKKDSPKRIRSVVKRVFRGMDMEVCKIYKKDGLFRIWAVLEGGDLELRVAEGRNLKDLSKNFLRSFSDWKFLNDEFGEVSSLEELELKLEAKGL